MGLDGDAVLFQRQLVAADGLKRGGARADAADHIPAAALDHVANRREIAKVLGERVRERVRHVGREHCVADAVLVEHVLNGELAAEGIAAAFKVHLADLVGIGLDEDGDVRVPERRHRAVFVAKVGQAQDHAVELAFMFLEEPGVHAAFFSGLDGAVLGERRVHRDPAMARLFHGLGHFLARTGDQRLREKASVCKIQREHQFVHELPFLLSITLIYNGIISVSAQNVNVLRRVPSGRFRSAAPAYVRRFRGTGGQRAR